MRVDHPQEQQFDRADLQLGAAHQMNDRGTYSDHPCKQCGEYYVQKKTPIGFRRRETRMGMNVMNGKKRGQTKKSGGKKY